MKTLLAPEKDTEQITGIWNEIYDAKDRNTILSAKVVAVKIQETLAGSTWELEFEEFPNIHGIVPFSETGLPKENIMNIFVGERVNVRIKGIDKRNNIVACTRRELVEEAHRRLLNIAKIDLEFEAPVVFTTEFQLGIDIGGGVLKIFHSRDSELLRSGKPNELYKIDQAVKVIIIKADKESGELEVALANPWDSVKYARGDVVIGKVIRLNKRYISLLLQPGIVGIAPYPINTPIPQYGQEIKCKVNSFAPQKREVSLSIFDPETIRGRKKNKVYWKDRNRRQNEQTTANETKLTVLKPVDVKDEEPAAEAVVIKNDAL